MPLDSNLFVLLVRPRTGAPGRVDLLVDNSGAGKADEPAYEARKDPSTGTITLVDPYTAAVLGESNIAPPPLPNASANPKHRLISLDSPPAEVHLRNKAGLSWAWEMEWEEVQYVWTRDIVSLVGGDRGYTLSVSRRPDPNYPVVVFRPEKKGGNIEILDYNLARVEPATADRKGLEIAALLALCHFIDHLFSLPPLTAACPALTPPIASTSSAPPASTKPAPPVAPPPAPAPQQKKVGLRTLATNEVEVTDPSPAALDAYCERCLSLLSDPSLLYLVLFASPSPNSKETVPAVAALAERVKRRRYKTSGEEVRLFVDDSGAAGSATEGGGKRREGKGSPLAPPDSLKIYLSRIDMSDLLPNHHRRPSTTPVRPVISFDERTGGGKDGKQNGKGEEGGGWRGWFGLP
ncbi:hypothetical protein NBRC10512_004300 [Rhodotorula toruloides]|uniref:RHTO0S04e08768g1_1 n=2 Tax=Rhodotorula toruloides TaxID=5286 RepID=A0A061ARG6_RHOTO|nr:uncharacterized protein RHTO_02131 [Rhodotorula toruloides NP11]EMS21260.1 hypothetical protein RHTO_02131 [Rhodotorula toruloides NP11]CDR39756.1 RHTO0S04e08768g1_1 [Rhodotorula toruloides]